MLELRAVSYRYAGSLQPALTVNELLLGEGEIIGLVGASESGKTTLCLVASGLAPRVVGGTLTGSLLLDGTDVVAEPMHALVGRVAVGFANPATQLSGVCGTVFEEVAFGPMNLGLPRGEILDRTTHALDALRIGELAARDPGQLSGGQQQLVAIASLLVLRPGHLVLDEPTAHLDPAGTRLVSEALGSLAASGISILLTEHKTDLLAGLCHRVVVLDQGRIGLDGPAADVLADARLPELGVSLPSAVRLERAAMEADPPPAALASLRQALRSLQAGR